MKNILQRLKEASAERAKDFPDYQRLVDCDVLYYAVALAGEGGELCNIVKKIERGDHTIHGQKPMDALADEIADVLIQLDLLCQSAGLDLETALVRKFNSKSTQIGSKVYLSHDITEEEEAAQKEYEQKLQAATLLGFDGYCWRHKQPFHDDCDLCEITDIPF